MVDLKIECLVETAKIVTPYKGRAATATAFRVGLALKNHSKQGVAEQKQGVAEQNAMADGRTC